MVGLINRVVKQRKPFGVNHVRPKELGTLLSRLAAGVVRGKMRQSGGSVGGKIRGDRGFTLVVSIYSAGVILSEERAKNLLEIDQKRSKLGPHRDFSSLRSSMTWLLSKYVCQMNSSRQDGFTFSALSEWTVRGKRVIWGETQPGRLL